MNNIATLHFPVRSNPTPDQAAIHPGYRTETAEAAGGYLEGALEASDRVFTALTL